MNINEVKCEVGNGKSRNLACVGKEIFELQHLNLTNFAKGNSINAGYYFEQFVNFISIHYSAELALEIRITLHCCKTNNYKFTTMFHLWLSTLCTSWP